MSPISIALAALTAVAALVPYQAAAHGPSHGGPAAQAETPFGRTGDPRRVARTVDTRMSDDMRFTPAQLTARAGELHHGCLVPGHFEAGMRGRITVLAKGESGR
jgi:uncharacterized cupredoxin-like copper-binding protein